MDERAGPAALEASVPEAGLTGGQQAVWGKAVKDACPGLPQTGQWIWEQPELLTIVPVSHAPLVWTADYGKGASYCGLPVHVCIWKNPRLCCTLALGTESGRRSSLGQVGAILLLLHTVMSPNEQTSCHGNACTILVVRYRAPVTQRKMLHRYG